MQVWWQHKAQNYQLQVTHQKMQLHKSTSQSPGHWNQFYMKGNKAHMVLFAKKFICHHK